MTYATACWGGPVVVLLGLVFSTGSRAALDERMSIVPWKEAPSAIAILGATRSPSTTAVSRILMVSLAVISPHDLAHNDDRLGQRLGLERAILADR